MSRGTFNSSNYFTTSVTPPITVYPFSLSCWMRSTVTTNTQYGFGFVLSSGNFDHAIIGLQSTGVVLYFLRRSGSLVLYSTTSYSANVWNNILAVSNSATDHRIYLNGGGKNTSATNIPFPAMALGRGIPASAHGPVPAAPYGRVCGFYNRLSCD